MAEIQKGLNWMFLMLIVRSGVMICLVYMYGLTTLRWRVVMDRYLSR